MTDRTEDRRVTKSKKAILAAMYSLLEENSFQKISVNDICARSQLSRSTFYAHFEDKYDLMRFALEALNEEINNVARELEPRDRLKAVLQSIYDNSTIYKNLFMEYTNTELATMFQTFFTNLFSEQLRQKEAQGGLIAGSTEFTAVFYSGGVASSIEHWIRKGYPASVSQLADSLHMVLKDILT